MVKVAKLYDFFDWFISFTLLFSFGPGRPGGGSLPPPDLSFGQMDLTRFPDRHGQNRVDRVALLFIKEFELLGVVPGFSQQLRHLWTRLGTTRIISFTLFDLMMSWLQVNLVTLFSFNLYCNFIPFADIIRKKRNMLLWFKPSYTLHCLIFQARTQCP